MIRAERGPHDDAGRTNNEQKAHAALATLIAEAKRDKITGNGAITLELNEGGIRLVKRTITRNE